VFEILRIIGRDDAAHFGVIARERFTLVRDGSVASLIDTPQMQVSWNHLYIAARTAISDGVPSWQHWRVGEADDTYPGIAG
jgi:hypothetical protein